MSQDDAIRELMAKLIQAVETSISASSAVREALAELVRNGYEARLFFVANADAADDGDGRDAEDEAELEATELSVEGRAPPGREIGAAPDGEELRFELTKLDRDFLKSLHIRPEGS